MPEHASFAVPGKGFSLALGRHPLLMGILNVTPDSFSDGGDFVNLDAALTQARLMADQGADILDVGGESTRPGADEVSTQAELDRVVPVLEALAEAGLGKPISIDTYKAVVADQAMQSGAGLVNDVWGFQREPEIADVAALYGAPAIAMHWDPERDRGKDLIDEMKRFFHRSITIADKAGIARDKLILDPGFGFAKNLTENYELLRRLGELHELGFPLLIGTSRKSMIGKLLDLEPSERLFGTLATSVLAYQAGGHIFRVHDIRPHREALAVAETTMYGPPSREP